MVRICLQRASSCILLLSVLTLTGCGTTAAQPIPPATHVATEPTSGPTATAQPIAAPTPTTVQQPTPTPVAGAAALGEVAFIRDGNLWVKDVTGGQERQLSQSGDMAEPAWSPSGAWLSVDQLAGDNTTPSLVGIEVASGRTVTLSSALVGSSEWSPAEDRLAYVTSDGAVISSPDGSNPISVPGATSIAWSNDGTHLAYARSDAAGAGVWVVDADGSGAREVQPADPSGAKLLLAGWSYDDAYVLGWADPLGSASLAMDGLPLEAIPLDGGAQVELAQAMLPHRDLLDVSGGDGSHLAATVGVGRSTWNQKSIAVGDPSGSLQSVSPEDRAELYPVWSPDARWLAFTSGPNAPASSQADAAEQAIAARRLWLMHPDGSDRHALVNAAAVRQERAEWSADGGMLLWIEPASETQFRLMLASTDGTSPPVPVVDGLGSQQFDPAGVYGYVDWSRLYAWWQPAAAPDSPQAAAEMVRRYYSAVAAGDYAAAYHLWADNGQASGQTPDQFQAGYADTAEVQAHVGPPGQIGAAAGSRYVDVPVEVFATTSSGVQQHFQGTLTLRRSVVTGATPDQRTWRIYSADVHQVS